MTYTDAILHIEDVAALIAWFSDNDPSKLNEAGDQIIGFARTPTVANGAQALAYVRVTADEQAACVDVPGVTVLAEAPYEGVDTPDRVYEALFADEEAATVYDAVYDRAPYEIEYEENGTVVITPPERFGQMA